MTQGEGAPVIAYLPECDALPGLSNLAEPRQENAPTEFAHGCGHNVLGAGSTGGAQALKRMMEAAAGTAGTIGVYGCASEKTESAKSTRCGRACSTMSTPRSDGIRRRSAGQASSG